MTQAKFTQYVAYAVVLPNGNYWTGRRFLFGPYDCKLFGQEEHAKLIAHKLGAQVKAIFLTVQEA